MSWNGSGWSRLGFAGRSLEEWLGGGDVDEAVDGEVVDDEDDVEVGCSADESDADGRADGLCDFGAGEPEGEHVSDHAVDVSSGGPPRIRRSGGIGLCAWHRRAPRWHLVRDDRGPLGAAIEFDLACFCWGDAAKAAAAEDGMEEIPVPNDYYIRNEADTLRIAEVDADATIHWFPASDNIEFEEAAWSDWVSGPAGYLSCPEEWCLAWIYVNDGAVTEVAQQYTP